MNEDFGDYGQQYAGKIRSLIDALVVILKDIEEQRQLLHLQQGKSIEWSQLARFLDLVNSAEYHLQELEKRIQEPL